MAERGKGRRGKPAEELVSSGRYGQLRRAELSLYKIDDNQWKSIASLEVSDLLSLRSGLVELVGLSNTASGAPDPIVADGAYLSFAEDESTGAMIIVGNSKNDALLSCLLFGVQLERWRSGQELATVEYRSNPHDSGESFKIKKLPVHTAIEGLEVLTTEMMAFQKKYIDMNPQSPKPLFGVFMNDYHDRLVSARVNRRIAIEREKHQAPHEEDEKPGIQYEEVIEEILEDVEFIS